jgi:hypothetical protein
VCFLFFPSTFLLVLHVIFLLLFLHSFITYLFLIFISFSFPFFLLPFLLFLFDERVGFVFWRYLLRICVRALFSSHFFDLDCYTEGILVSNLMAVALSLLCRGLFGIYRFPNFVLIRI